MVFIDRKPHHRPTNTPSPSRIGDGASRQMDRGNGTACQLRFERKILLMNIIGSYSRRICSFRLWRTATCAGYKYSYSLAHS